MSSKAKIPRVTSADVCRDGGKSSISPHLENQGTEKRKVIKPRAETVDMQLLTSESTDYKRQQLVTFYGNTGNKAWRFMDGCIIITLLPREKNPDFEVAEKPKADREREWNGMKPFDIIYKDALGGGKEPDKNRRVYFYNPVTGSASNLIAEIEVLLDGQLVQADRTGYFPIYNTLNRVFIPSDMRTEIVGHPYILHSSNDTKKLGELGNTKFLYKSPNYEYALMELNALNDKEPEAVILTADLDGIFPLSRPKNLGLEAISHCNTGLNQHPLIPPNTEITIRIRLADPLHFRLGDSGMPNSKYFNAGADVTVDDNDKFQSNNINFHIKDISLAVQKFSWDDEKVQRQLRNGSVSYTFDQYIHRSRALPSNEVKVLTTEKIPAGTGLVYVAYVRQNQLWKDGMSERSSDASRFCLPPGLTSVMFKLNGNTILFENGLKLSRDTAYKDPDAKLFHTYLLNRRLTTDSFESFFPRAEFGFKQVFPLDLTPWQIDKPSDLTVISNFDQGSPPNYHVLMIIPQAVELSKPSPTSIWNTTANVA